MNLSNSLISKIITSSEYYDIAITYNKLVSENHITNINDIYDRLFKIYLSLNLFNEAEFLLKLLEGQSKNYKTTEQFNSNLNLLKSKQNERFLIKIKETNTNNISLKTPNIINNCKANRLTNFALSFSFINPYKPTRIILVLETKHKQSNGSYIQQTISKQVNGTFTNNFNFLNIKKIGYKLNEDDTTIWIFEFSTLPIQGVIRGKSNWLFLDNDSNQSVNQFKGELLINEAEIKNWNLFTQYLENINNSFFLITPSKESVRSEFYPYPKANVRPINQILKILEHSKIKYLYPINLLSTNISSYSKTETHWSQKAGDSVLRHIISKLGVDLSNYIPPYGFNLIDWLGDLGSKCEPPEYSKYFVYDKILDIQIEFSNFIDSCDGTIRKFVNTQSITNKKILIFCSSSIYYCLNTLKPIFRYIIFIWSNSTIIEDIINFERPDIVLIQTNERFLVKAPRIIKSISDYPSFIRTNKFTYHFYEKIYNYECKKQADIYDKYMTNYKSILQDFVSIEFDTTEKELLDTIFNLKLFDESFYLENYSINLSYGMDPIEHYLILGWRKGYNPSKVFDTNYYLSTNIDVKQADICPLTHYVRYGILEKRAPHPN